MPTTMPLIQLLILMALVCVVAFGVGWALAWLQDNK
jgi:hypothetical protein